MKQQTMKKQSGFTLIELVIVIIILGILAATAVPKFVDLQSDARQAAMKGVKGALEGAASITYSKAAVDGHQKLDSSTANEVAIAYGYPQATATALAEAAGLSDTDWDFSATARKAAAGETAATPGVIIITADGVAAADALNCRVTYTEAADADSRPSIVALDTGC